MFAPTYSQEDFATAYLNLLPTGKVWPRDPDSVMANFWYAMAGTQKRLTDVAGAASLDSPPFNLNQMLPEWEAALGLPDNCVTAVQSFSQRVAAVRAKLTAIGGQSAAYFIQLAAALGYPDAVVTNYAPFRAGRSHCGSTLGLSEWFFYWTIYIPSLAVTYFECGLSACGDPLWTIAGNTLECTIKKYAPAHTVVAVTGN